MKIRNDGPSPNRLSPVPRSKYVAIGGRARTSTSRAGRPSNPSAYRASHASSGTKDRDRQQDGRGHDGEETTPERAPDRRHHGPTALTEERAAEPATRFGRVPRPSSTAVSVGSASTGAGRGRARAPSLLPAHGPSPASETRSDPSSPSSPSATTPKRRVAQMPGTNATAKTIAAASAHRVSVVPRVELGRRRDVDQRTLRVVFERDQPGVATPLHGDDRVARQRDRPDQSRRTARSARRDARTPTSTATRRPSPSPSRTDDPDTTGELRSTTSFRW